MRSGGARRHVAVVWGAAAVVAASVACICSVVAVMLVVRDSPPVRATELVHVPSCASNDLCRSSCSLLCEAALPPALPDPSYSHAESVSSLLSAGCCTGQMLAETFTMHGEPEGRRRRLLGIEGNDNGGSSDTLDMLSTQLEADLPAVSLRQQVEAKLARLPHESAHKTAAYWRTGASARFGEVPSMRTTQLQLADRLPGVNIDAGWSLDSTFPGLAGVIQSRTSEGENQRKASSKISTCCNPYFGHSSAKARHQQLMQISAQERPQTKRVQAPNAAMSSLLDAAPVGPVSRWLDRWFQHSAAHGAVVLEQKVTGSHSKQGQANLEQLAALPPAESLTQGPSMTLSPQSVEPQYYPTVPKTPSALSRNDFPSVKVELNETDYTPGYVKQEPGDLSVYSRRAPSLWVNTGMAEAPGTTLTQQSFALNLIQPRVERDERKLELQFEAARLGRGNLTLADGSPALVVNPALGIHKVMKRRAQMRWTIEHWNDECFDYSPHYVSSMPSGNVRSGERLSPCPSEKEREKEEETGLEPGEGFNRNAGAEQGGGTRVEATSAGASVQQQQVGKSSNGSKKAKRSKEAEAEAAEAARRALHGFKDVQIDGAEYVPVFIPKGHPELATARLPRGMHAHVRAQHALHRAFTSQTDAHMTGVDGTDTLGGKVNGASGVGFGGRILNKIAGVEKLVEGIVASLSSEAGSTIPRSTLAASSGGSAPDAAGGSARAQTRRRDGAATVRRRRRQQQQQQQVLVKRLRGVVKELANLRKGPAAGVKGVADLAQQQQQGHGQWSDYELGQYAVAYKASPDMVAPWKGPGAAAGMPYQPLLQPGHNLQHNTGMHEIAAPPAAAAAAAEVGTARELGAMAVKNKRAPLLASARGDAVESSPPLVAASGEGSASVAPAASSRQEVRNGEQRDATVPRGRQATLHHVQGGGDAGPRAEGPRKRASQRRKGMSGGAGAVKTSKLGGDDGEAAEVPAMYPIGYHVGSAYQPYVPGYGRRMRSMALDFCHSQFVDPHEVKFCLERLLKPADPDAAGASLKKDEALLLGQER